MDADRFDTLARTLGAPASRRAALGGALAGGLLNALGLSRNVPEAYAAQGNICVMTFAAQVLQGPSAGQVVMPNAAQAGEVRGELSFSLSASGNLQNAALSLPDGVRLPVVGQATGHALQVRIQLAPRVAVVAVGVGEQEIATCGGAIDGVVSGPRAGDLGDWHAAVVGGGGGGGQAGGGGGQAGGQRAGASTAAGGRDATGGRSDRDGGGRANAGGGTASGGGSRPAGGSTGGGSQPSGGGATGGSGAGGSTSGSNGSSNGGGSGQAACPEGESFCDREEGYCADLQTDPLNCGECGLPCASELGAGSCIGGACACSPGTTRCDDVCVNTERDPLNCGGCGNECPDDGECFDGACAAAQTASCPEGQTRCGGECVDLDTDQNNCGDCGVLCPVSPESFNCEEGVCVSPSCDPLVNCGGLCVDLQTDPLHCSACGLACAADERCSGGLCVPIGGGGGCKTGLTPCGPTCADLQTNANNCGACGAACPAGEACVGGECAAGCPEGQLLCGDTCRDAVPNFGSDGLSCPGGGAPPTACPAGRVLCNGACFPEGACQPTDCPPGWGYCYGVCRDFLTDPGYCGSCSNACPGGICSGGACVACGAGLTPCGATCVDTATDLDNCGFCGNLCGTQCLDGQCTGIGPSPLDITPACAGTGESCADSQDGPVVRPCCAGNRCISGTCYVEAGTGEYPCGRVIGSPNNCGGFCVYLLTDPNFCGDCGTRCPVGSACQNGNCTFPSAAASGGQTLAPTDVERQPEPEPAAIEPEPAAIEPEPAAIAPEPEPPAFSCPEGQVDCGGICTDVFFDPFNCGSCGFACGSGSSCDFGVCGEAPAPPPAPEDANLAPPPTEPEVGEATCVAAGGACDPASPGACCSGACNDDGSCA